MTVLATVTGPFGTLHSLTPIPRFGYWALVAAISVMGNQVVCALSKDRGALTQWLIWALFVLCTSTFVYLPNTLIFEGWRGIAMFLYLLGVVAVIVLVVHGVMALVQMVHPTSPAASITNPQAQFLTRIPLSGRGPLIRIEAQDHYLNVITEKGSNLILLRLSEAVKELGSEVGLQVHRSHWVALAAITKHRRTSGRDLLVMTDGTEVPVSRSYRDATRAADLF